MSLPGLENGCLPISTTFLVRHDGGRFQIALPAPPGGNPKPIFELDFVGCHILATEATDPICRGWVSVPAKLVAVE